MASFMYIKRVLFRLTVKFNFVNKLKKIKNTYMNTTICSNESLQLYNCTYSLLYLIFQYT